MFEILNTAPLYDIDKRLIFKSGKWMVRTREIPELGPYYSRPEAIEALYRHVAICTGQLRTAEPGLAREFVRHNTAECRKSECTLCSALSAMTPGPGRPPSDRFSSIGH